jgi:hypothetical protein
MEVIRAEFIRDTTVCNGAVFKGTDQVGRLCRELKAGTLQIYRSDMLCMTLDIAERAEKSLGESDRGLRFSKYQPFDRSVFAQDAAQA